MADRKTPYKVSILSTARLHMGFLDLHGGLGRRYGSIGLSLERPALRLSALRGDAVEAEGPGAQRALACARQFAERAGLPGGARLTLDEVIPEHAGLGSGTQLALAVGVALTRLYDLPLTLREVAELTGRGARSGIGIGAFEAGGLLLDGGRGERTRVPPVICRLDFPASWRVLLMLDRSGQGVHGSQEVEAFRALPEFPADTAAALCRRALMQALPAVAEQDLQAFGAAIYEIQCRIGDHFAAAQGGARFTSAAVSEVLEWLRGEGVACVGQSSWGPTGFAVLSSEQEARRMLEALEARFAGREGLGFMLCNVRNQGSDVRVTYEDDLVDRACTVN